MAAKADEYDCAQLFAQQKRVTRLLYTLRDINEIGLVVDFNRLHLVRKVGGALLTPIESHTPWHPCHCLSSTTQAAADAS
jgi:hypothetical protein